MNLSVLLNSSFINTYLSKNSLKHCATSSSPEKDIPLLTETCEARRFMIDCLLAAGAPQTHAEIVADNLTTADYRGHFSHGMNRLIMYIDEIQNGISDPKADPTIEKESPSIALVNGNDGLGAVIGKFCMDLSIKKATEVGAAFVAAHGSNHFGLTGQYTLQAVQDGLIGICLTNTAPLVVPTRAKEVGLGTNPISMSAPGCDGENVLLDMATSATAVGKLEFYNKKGIPLQEGWALNENGEVETNPEIALKTKLLLPLGGVEETGGYKGYGLAMMVEILCGILSGSDYGPKISKFQSMDGNPKNLGHCFIAINPKFFAQGFETRLSDLLNSLKKLEPTDKDKPVILPGEMETKHMSLVDREGGISYVKAQHEIVEKLAKKLNVKPLQSTKKKMSK